MNSLINTILIISSAVYFFSKGQYNLWCINSPKIIFSEYGSVSREASESEQVARNVNQSVIIFAITYSDIFCNYIHVFLSNRICCISYVTSYESSHYISYDMICSVKVWYRSRNHDLIYAFDYRNIFEAVGLKLIFDPACFDPTLEQRSNFDSSIFGGTASCNPWQSENDIIWVLSFIVFWIFDHEWDSLCAESN